MYRSSCILTLALLVSSATLLTGCSGLPAATSPNPTAPTGPTANTGAAQRIYVIQQPSSGGGTILQFAATSSGVVAPVATITPGTAVQQVATDELGNIYMFNGNIVEYASDATGTPSPVREITAGSASRICCVDGMAVSPAGAIVIGQDNGEVDEWSASATGDVAPERYLLGYSEIGGGLSPVVVANQVAVDASDNLYVGAAGAPGIPEVILFGPTASGNVAPSGTLGPDGLVGGLTVDSSGNVYTAGTSCSSSGDTLTCSGIISVYAAGATAASSPTRSISGASTLLGNPAGIRVDAVGNIYVISTGSNGANPTVLKFAANATGNIAPVSSFTSTAWTTPGFNPSIAIY